MATISRTIIITGAGSGIGFHMAAALLAAGDQVGILDVQTAGIQLLIEQHGERCLAVPCDVSDRRQVAAAVESLVRHWGRIDVLINNACVCHFRPFEAWDADELRHEIDVDLFGYVHTMTAVLPIMKRQGGGLIYNMSSGVGLSGFPGIAAYAAAKGAIEALTRSVALELEGTGVTVSLMHPPLTRTPSAAPLGIPLQAMADPATVGRRLAKRVGSRRPVVTPDFATALSLLLFRCLPTGTGRLLGRLTQRARAAE